MSRSPSPVFLRLVSDLSCPQSGAAAGDMSCGNRADTGFTAPTDLYRFRRGFGDLVRGYFRDTGMSAAEIAVAYGVDPRSAQNWLDGLVRPSGDSVALIALRDPDGFRRHFGAPHPARRIAA